MTSPSEQLLDTVTQLLVDSGYEGVSVRKVATRAGVSIGAVQHHFPTKDAMLMAAMQLVSRQFRERLSQRVPEGAGPPEALQAVVDELLGLGPERRSATVLWVLRAARAAVDPGVAEAHAAEWQDVEDLLTALITESRPDKPGAWGRAQAGTLLALLDGLAMSVLLEPKRMPAARVTSIAGEHIDRLLGGT